MNRITTATAGLAVAAVSFAGLSGTAFADSASTTPTTSTASPTASPSARPAHGNALAVIQAKAAAAITRRLSAISVAVNDINNSTVISAGDKTTLLATLNGDTSGLTALGTTIAADTTAKQAAMADLATQITAIGAATSGLSATVLAFTPAQYDANHALLSPSRAALATSRNDVKTARADITTVTKALK